MNRQAQGYDWNQGDDVLDDHDLHSDSFPYDQSGETASSSNQSHHGHQETAVAHAQYSTIHRSINPITTSKVIMTNTRPI